MINLPFEIREVFPFVFLNEPMESIVAWNFWILIFQSIIGVILVFYLRKIVQSFEVKSRQKASQAATYFFRKKERKEEKQSRKRVKKRSHKNKVDSAVHSKKTQQKVPVKKRVQKRSEDPKPKQPRKKQDKDPFKDAQEIE